MAKSLLLNVLVDVLGQYVEGLTRENLKLGVWSGKIEFLNLKLKDSALDQLNLPIQVKKGSLKRLQVKVPWTSLESKPVEVLIDGLYLLAAPLDLTQNTPEEGRKMNQAMRMKKLKQIDDAVMLSVTASKDLQASAKQASYLQQLATSIIDNLEVQVTNIHIRYEDSISEHGKTYCFGITLDKVVLTTTDENWNVRFVKRDAANRAASSINKLGQVNNVGVYWNTNERSQASMSSAEWEDTMFRMIYRDEQRDTEKIRKLDFILSPPNQLILKLTHREVCSETQPNVDLVIETTQINITLDRQQFRQLMVMNRSFGELDRKRLMCLYRPFRRATEDPRGWWHYAFRLVTGKNLNTAHKLGMLTYCIRNRKKYIETVKKHKVDSFIHKDHPPPPLGMEISIIEETLPLPTLLLFREDAMKGAALEIRRHMDAEATTPAKSSQSSWFSSSSTAASPSTGNATPATPGAPKKSSYFSGWFASSKKTETPPAAPAVTAGHAHAAVTTPVPPAAPALAVTAKKTEDAARQQAEDAEDQKLMDDLEMQMQRLNEASIAAISQKFSFRGRLQSSAHIVASYDGKQMVTITAGMGLLIETRYSNVLLNFSLHNFSVEDHISVDPFDKMLIIMADRQVAPVESSSSAVVRAGNDAKVPFSFILEIKPDLISMKFIALPVIITWNKDCIKHFIHFITSSTSDESKANINPLLKASLEQFSAEAALPKVETEIIIDIDAPKIIMPEDRGRCPCYTVLDTGFLSMRGKLNQHGMDFSIGLRNVNISMPDTSKPQLPGVSPYLITPFDFLIALKSRDEVDPVVHVDMNLVPRVRADMDGVKLVRLILVILVLLETVDTSTLDPKNDDDDDDDYGDAPILLVGGGGELEVADSDISRLRREDSLEVAAGRKKRPVNFAAMRVICTFALPELVLSLKVTEGHLIELVLKEVFLQVFQRAGDSSIDTEVKSLDIYDTQRTQDHPAILVARPDENSTSDKLLKVVYRTISNKQSPYYRGNASELLINITRISLFLDAVTLKSYSPLMAEFMDTWMSRIEIPKAAAASAAAREVHRRASTVGMSSKRRSVIGGPDAHPTGGTPTKRGSMLLLPGGATTNTAVAKKKGPAGPSLGGLFLEFALESVGLTLLQPRHSKFSSLNMTSDMIEYFEASFLFNISKLDVCITADKTTKVKATLNAIELIDLRKSSEKMVFKKVLRTGKMFDADDMDQDPLVNLHEHLLYITFEQDEQGASNVDVTVRNLSTIIAVDVVMDLVAVIMQNVDSVLVLVSKSSPSVEAKELHRLASSNIDVVEEEVVKPSQSGDFVLSVSVINPRLILLEDPLSANSKAIQSRCGIYLRYVIHNVSNEDSEQRGSFHTSVRDIETFAILDLSRQTAVHRIIEPLGIEVHFNNRTVRSQLLTMQVSVAIQEIFLRLSLNDIVLVQNIFTRVGEIAKQNAQLANREVDMDGGEVTQTVVSASETGENLTVYSFRFCLDHLNAILINDYQGQSSPMIRFDVLNTEFSINGALIGLEGDGSMTLQSDYYNSPLSCWEPVMEKWKPSIIIKRDFMGILTQIQHQRLIQFNVSGELLKCIVSAIDLVSRIGREGSYQSRKDTIPLSFRNELGVPVEIVDHKSMQLIAQLGERTDQSTEDDVIIDVDAGFDLSAIPEVDVYLGGEYANVYAPLQRLSTRSRRAKVYHLHTLHEEHRTQGAAQAIAPVIEEVYQYSRFNFVKNKWERPWAKVGDPHEWADALGKGNKDPSKYKLPHSWEWVDPEWTVDLSFHIGKEIDKDGWEYATSFPAFSLNNPKHTKLPTDCVRRRRWIRRRAMLQTVEVAASRSLASHLVWEVMTNDDESKTVVLKSTKIFRNDMHVDLEVSFDGVEDRAALLLPKGTSVSVSLRDVSRTRFHIRPHNTGCRFSEYISFTADVSGRGAETLRTAHCYRSSPMYQDFFVGYVVNQRENITTVILYPIMEVHNFLPCPIQCDVNAQDGSRDSLFLQAGESLSVTGCGISDTIPMGFALGPYTSSEVFNLPPREDAVLKLVTLFGDHNRSLVISVRLKMNSAGVLSMLIYTSLLFVDRTNLRLTLGVQQHNPIQRSKGGEFMYTVTNVVNPHNESNWEHGQMSWAVGANGISLFEPGDNKFVIATMDGQASIKNLTGESFGPAKSNHEVFDNVQQRFYHLAVKCEPYPLAADLTHVLTVMPSFHIVNCLRETLALRQRDVAEEYVIYVGAKRTSAWHSPSPSVEFTMHLRTETCDWSLGTININEIGTSTLILPIQGVCDMNQNNFRTINCEVRFSEPDDASYITVVIWESTIRRHTQARKFIFDTAVNLSVKNESAVPLVVRQAGLNVGQRLREQRRPNHPEEIAKYEALVSPGEWLAYGWTDADVNQVLEISVPTSLNDNVIRPVTVNMMQIGSEVTLDLTPMFQRRELLTCKVKVHANGRALVVSGRIAAEERRLPNITDTDANTSSAAMVSNDFSLQLSLQTISISIIADKPQRRELFTVYLERLGFFVQHVAKTAVQEEAQWFEFKLQDMQIDNFSETAVFPVLLTSVSAQERRDRKAKDRLAKLNENNNNSMMVDPRGSAMEGSVSTQSSGKDSGAASPEPYLNFIEFSCFRSVPADQKIGILQAVAFRMLEVKVTLDSASILIYITDLHSEILEKANTHQLAQKLSMTRDAEEFNTRVMEFLRSERLNNVEWQYTQSQHHKLYIEKLVIHPMRVSLSFYPNRFPRSTKAIHPSLRWMRSLENVTSVEDFELRINSYIATNVLEPLPRLMESIGTKVVREIRSNLLKIAGNLVGSLSLLGKPAGLYKKIGGGVEDFFYEPYQGLMESPRSFVKGIGKGTSRLISGVASGVVGSASNIVGTASGGVASVARGVARISGNETQVKRNEERRREMKASGGGVMAGLKAGGESVASGFAAGISGLVTKPFEEGRKGGAMGFLKGMGQGIIGVAVNPVMGVTEGISSVAQGINRSFSSDVGTVHIRPKRAFYRRDPDLLDELILVPLVLFYAEAQSFVEKRAVKKNYSDQFICAATLGFPVSSLGDEDPQGLVLSRQFMFLLAPNGKLLWSVQIAQISHLELVRAPSNSTLQHQSSSSSLSPDASNTNNTRRSSVSGGADNGVRYFLRVVEYEQSPGLTPRQVPCSERRSACEAYDIFVHFRRYFGSPNRMEPSETVLGATSESGSGSPTPRTSTVGASASARQLLSAGAGGGNTPRLDMPRGDSSSAIAGAGSPTTGEEDSGPRGRAPSASSLDAGRNTNITRSASSNTMLPTSPSVATGLISPPAGGPGPYSFGTANNYKLSSDRLNEKQILLRGQENLLSRMRGFTLTRYEDQQRYHQALDECLWRFVSDWVANHDMLLNPSRCCVCVLLNYARSPVQILGTELKEGADLQILGVGDGYDAAGRVVRPHGGAVVLFAKGHRPSLVSKEHVKIKVETNACVAEVATRENRANCAALAGFSVAFLEKSRTDWWAKYVILLT